MCKLPRCSSVRVFPVREPIFLPGFPLEGLHLRAASPRLGFALRASPCGRAASALVCCRRGWEKLQAFQSSKKRAQQRTAGCEIAPEEPAELA